MQKELNPIKVDLKGRDMELIAKVDESLAVHVKLVNVEGGNYNLELELWPVGPSKPVVRLPLTRRALKALRPLIYHDTGTDSDPKQAKLEDNPSCIVIHY